MGDMAFVSQCVLRWSRRLFDLSQLWWWFRDDERWQRRRRYMDSPRIKHVVRTLARECSLCVICNCLQHIWRCGAHTICRAPSHRNYGKEIPTCAFPRFLQRTGPRAVTDGRKQKGFVLSLGKLWHPRSLRLHLTERDDRVARNSLKVSAHLLPRLRRRGS
jgi:hypothetical protein